MEWLSDYVLSFLKSPTWSAPIAQFVDEQCIIFEDQEENKLEYTECHNEYKELIDSRFAAHLLEIDVTSEQFEQFCQRGLSTNPSLHRVLVEQLLSADDFLIFKAMMTKRNADLYREAQRRVDAGLEDDFYETMVEEDDEEALAAVGSTAALVADEWKIYEEQLFKALDESQKEDDQLARERQKEEEEMERAIALSLEEDRRHFEEPFEPGSDEPASSSAAPAPPVEVAASSSSGGVRTSTLPPLKPSAALGPLRPVIPRVMRVAPMSEGAFASRPGTATATASGSSEAPPPPPPPAEEAEEAASSEVVPPPPAPPAAPQPSEAERQARFEHLQRQRQLLVEKRNKERQKQLENSPKHGRKAADLATSPSGSGAPSSLVRELTGEPRSSPEAHAATAVQQMRQVLASQLKQTLRHV